MNTDAYTDEDHVTMLEEERNDYESCLEILQKRLDGILADL